MKQKQKIKLSCLWGLFASFLESLLSILKLPSDFESFNNLVITIAIAKSLQSCPTLCDPIDGSPPGSPVPGIRGLPSPSPMHESEKWKWSRSVMSDLATPWAAAFQAPPSMGFSRHECWSGAPLYSPWMLINVSLSLPSLETYTIGGASGKGSAYQCRRWKRQGFSPWIRKIPWRRKWHPTPVFLPGKFHGHRSLASCSPWSFERLRHGWAPQHTHSISSYLRKILTIRKFK